MESRTKDYIFGLSILILAGLFSVVWTFGVFRPTEKASGPELEEKVVPSEGVVLPVRWGNLGQQLIENGVLDPARFEELYSGREGFGEEERELLYRGDNGMLRITRQNAGVLLNLLWALGLGNKNEILEKGPMTDPKFGDPANFASTGGWSLARGGAMEHYSKHPFAILTDEQQLLVERVSKNIYRPCCDNPTHFPDCNHGMAMLGLLELLASEGASEEEMYRAALQANSYWFPDDYLMIAGFLQRRGIDWEEANPREALGFNFSSASGFDKIREQEVKFQNNQGPSCGV